MRNVVAAHPHPPTHTPTTPGPASRSCTPPLAAEGSCSIQGAGTCRMSTVLPRSAGEHVPRVGASPEVGPAVCRCTHHPLHTTSAASCHHCCPPVHPDPRPVGHHTHPHTRVGDARHTPSRCTPPTRLPHQQQLRLSAPHCTPPGLTPMLGTHVAHTQPCERWHMQQACCRRVAGC